MWLATAQGEAGAGGLRAHGKVNSEEVVGVSCLRKEERSISREEHDLNIYDKMSLILQEDLKWKSQLKRVTI